MPSSTRAISSTRALSAAALIAATAVLSVSGTASAGIVPAVPLATAGNYSVLGATTVTNTNPSVLGQSVGLSPGPSIVGFPPGIVLAPATIEAANATTLQAQLDLTTAYVDAAGRSVEFPSTNPDLVGLTLVPGVYAAASKAPLGLSGQLVLDGQGDPNAVFVFQTDSTLITGSGSTISLINGASECNVFWQVGSSATLGSGSLFVGTILALASVTVQNGTVVHGRALARTGAVTLDNDVFTSPSCAPSTDTSPTATAPTTAPTTTVATPTTTAPPVTTVPLDGTAAPSTTPAGPAAAATTNPFGNTDLTLPRTGSTGKPTSVLAGTSLAIGALAVFAARRRRPA